jgi:S-adenosylmethionine hydrolase
LTTDFGYRDSYAAAKKGVILSRCLQARILDLRHGIEPRDITDGALFLAGAVPHFSRGTIHVAVVDPGVGTKRLPIVAKAAGQIIVCPDNGLLTLLAQLHPLEEARTIENPEFMLNKVSATFHGRDIFAPAAAAIASGRGVEDAGERLDMIELLDPPRPRAHGESRVEGQVIHADRFGNLISNVHRSMLNEEAIIATRIGSVSLPSLLRTYGDAAPNEALALIGSSGFLEIAVNGGNAQRTLKLGRGDAVEVNW